MNADTRLAYSLDMLLANTPRTYVVSLFRAIRNAANFESSPSVVFASDVARFIAEALERQASQPECCDDSDGCTHGYTDADWQGLGS